jgi:20S proteasome alpha/beta subunit
LTCIAVLKSEDNIWMAGDRGASDDDSIMPLTAPKVFKIGPYLLGYAGTMDGERVRHNFKPPLPKPGVNIDKFMYTDFIIALRNFYETWWVDISKDSDFGMIICVKGKIYEHNAVDMSLTTYESDYLAMGSGSPWAMGSLYTTRNQKNGKRRVQLAVEAAIEYSTSCKGPIDIIGG